MNKKTYLSINKGFTLVEIIVAIAIAGIVSLIALKLFSFGNNTLNKTEDRSYNQMSVRNASIAITDKIRYAKELQLLNDSEIPLGKGDTARNKIGYDYIYFDYTDKSLKVLYEDSDGNKHEKTFLKNKLNPDILKSYFTLEAPSPPPALPPSLEQIRFEITGKGDKYKDDSHDYSIKTTVNLVNSSEITGLGPKDTTTQPNPPGMALSDSADPLSPLVITVPSPNSKGKSIHYKGIRYKKVAK